MKFIERYIACSNDLAMISTQMEFSIDSSFDGI